jgi:flagellar FliJ protein
MFRFRFETVLNQRRLAEEILQKDLAEAQRELSAERAALRGKRNARRLCLLDLQRRRSKGFRAPEILIYAPYLERMDDEIEFQLKRVAAAERKVNQTRLAVIEAMKNRKILDKLKEKARDRHRQTLDERERKFVDDVASRQHVVSSHRL